MSIGGYQPTVLHIDLTASTIERRPLPDEDTLRKFIGGAGLGIAYLLRERMDLVATDPRGPLIFMTGPLAGTTAPSSANWAVVCFHLSIPYSAAIGHGHGFWAARLKQAGYEGVVIRGRAERPTYLWVDDGRVELRDASLYWGLGTRETERRIAEDLGDSDRISVACIGPGGEAVLPGGLIKVDRNHAAGKGSPGSIMGSKNLKAIAVRGSGRVPVANPDAFAAVVGEWLRAIEVAPPAAAANRLRDGRAPANLARRGADYRVAFKNLTDPEGGKVFGRNYTNDMSRWKITPRPSFNCPIGCAFDVQITDGEFAGFRASLCGGAENIEGAAGMVGVADAAQTVVLAEHYDDMGLEAGVFGAITGAAFEAFEKGLLTSADTDGLELRWGDWEAALELINRIIRREGIGARLARALEETNANEGEVKGLGREFATLLYHIKGAGINMHDWRPVQSVQFGYIVSGAGPTHFGLGSDHAAIPELGVAGFGHQPPISDTLDQALAKVRDTRITSFAKMWFDSLGICWFAVSGVSNVMRSTVDSVRYATGWDDFTIDEALRVGERIVHALRLIYERRGFTKKQEFDYGQRYTEPAPAGPARGKSLEPFVRPMIDEYYRQMGWDVETGYVTSAALARFGLSERLEP